MSGSSTTILLVDDRVDVQEAVADFLGTHGITTLSASTPEEAVAKASTPEVSLVLMDVNLGYGFEEGGIEAAKLIREKYPRIKCQGSLEKLGWL